MNFQTDYGAPGCKRGDNCNYKHEMCPSREVYDDLVRIVSDSGNEGVRQARSELRNYCQKFCRYGTTCRNKDDSCKKNHSKTQEQWMKEKAKLDDAVKAATEKV